MMTVWFAAALATPETEQLDGSFAGDRERGGAGDHLGELFVRPASREPGDGLVELDHLRGVGCDDSYRDEVHGGAPFCEGGCRPPGR